MRARLHSATSRGDRAALSIRPALLRWPANFQHLARVPRRRPAPSPLAPQAPELVDAPASVAQPPVAQPPSADAGAAARLDLGAAFPRPQAWVAAISPSCHRRGRSRETSRRSRPTPTSPSWLKGTSTTNRAPGGSTREPHAALGCTSRPATSTRRRAARNVESSYLGSRAGRRASCA